jgi:hypothetical protein
LSLSLVEGSLGAAQDTPPEANEATPIESAETKATLRPEIGAMRSLSCLQEGEKTEEREGKTCKSAACRADVNRSCVGQK